MIMSTAEDTLLDRDVKHVGDSSHRLQHNTAGDPEECEQDKEKENSESGIDAVWFMDAVAASSETPAYTPAQTEEKDDAEPHDVAAITPETPGHVMLKETPDTESSASASSSSHQMSNENEENVSNAQIAEQGESIHIQEVNAVEPRGVVVITPEKRVRALLRETSDTKGSTSASSFSSRQMSNGNEENESITNIAAEQPSQKNLKALRHHRLKQNL